MIRLVLSLVLALLLLAANVVACQYTVRDIGFVDLKGAQYTLVVRAPRALEGRLGDWDYLDDTNIKLLFDWADEAGAAESARPESTVELVDEDGKRLVVVSRTSELESLSDVVFEALFSTNWIKQLRRDAVGSFAQIVLIETSDQQQNDDAFREVENAVQAMKRIEPLLPRPVVRPITILRVPAADASKEHILNWSLAGDSPSRPVVAVLYGRLKLAGKPLVGQQITLREILGQLALVGESCECETDRTWNDEHVLPGYWPKEFRTSASSALGFDPESPLVQAEISRILSRGPSERRDSGERLGDGVDDIEQILLGYDERSVGLPAASDLAAGLESTTASSTDPDLTIVIESGEGWGFDEVVDDTDSRTETLAESSDASSESDSVQTTSGNGESFSALMIVLGSLAAALLLLGFVFQWLMRA